MIIDCLSDYNDFFETHFNSEMIVDCIQEDSNLHHCATKPIVLLVRIVNIKECFAFCIDHSDQLYSIDVNRLVSDFNFRCRGKIWVFNKKRMINIFPINDMHDLNALYFSEYGKKEISSEEVKHVNAFYRNIIAGSYSLNSIIPIYKHIEHFQTMCDEIISLTSGIQIDITLASDTYQYLNTSLLVALAGLEKNGLYVDRTKFFEYFPDKGSLISKDNLVYTQYNIYTSTGRPSNSFGSINFSALNKENGVRDIFVSRYGSEGVMFMVDYSSYHPRIISRLINYSIPVNVNVYKYLGQYYYGKTELTNDEIQLSKKLTFQLLYGDISDEFKEIPFFKKINEYISHRWEFFCKNGYVETPMSKRRITKRHIQDATPNKLFNYILQASETEFGMTSIQRINSYLYGKKTKAVLYTYDSMLFDVYIPDTKQCIEDIRHIMTDNGNFPVKSYIGYNYGNMTEISW